MKNRLRTSSKSICAILFLSVLWIACFEPTDGCLDSNANNFDVYADENCCCTYPSITVAVFQKYGDDNHHVDSIYTNALGQQFQIREQAFYLSNMELVYSNGVVSQVLDTLEIELPLNSGNDIVLEDNFALVTDVTSAFSPGDIATNGIIDQVRFNVGLTAENNMLVPDQFASNHPLGSNNASSYYMDGEGYVFYTWLIKVLNVSGVDEIFIQATGSTALQMVSIDWDGSDDNVIAPGSVSIIPLQIKYDKWLEGIDFEVSIETIQSQITANTVNAFDIGQ